ncbi:MAG: DNA recombination protein RmuC [Muribaculaceae bacterium]|nr:DNA recombination protein RmuC [Muribaculaceae bacterium]
MISTLSILIAVIAVAFAIVMNRTTEKTRRDLDSARANLATLQAENARLVERLDNQETEYRRREVENQLRFKNLSTEILRQQSEIFKTEHETRLNEILAPLRQEVDRLGKNITETYSAEARERFALAARIKELVETNQSIGREAKELSTALRGNNKVQGDWGEMVLETILSKSGLIEGIHYTMQQTTDDAGRTLRDDNNRRLRPDVVVSYPDGRSIIIDSKVSLNAFIDLVAADDDQTRTHAAARHLASVKKHVATLAAKSYQDHLGPSTVDFVIMFIPVEPAYIEAMRLDNKLWQDAYDRRVLIVSPTHLISALRLVARMWTQEAQYRNALDIATAAGRMYDKFVAFVGDMEKIDKAINTTRTAYTAAMNKLADGNGNLISRARKLRDLGAKTTKNLPDEQSLPQ